MGETTKIEWADKTFNPWIGCTKVSPACDDCYAEFLMDTRLHRVVWGSGQARARTSEAYWREPLRWDREAREAGTRPFVFGGSLCDPFDNEVPDEWRSDYLGLIDATPHLVWLLLTKRVANVPKMIRQGELPRNVAIGATTANQPEYDRDAPNLYKIRTILGPLFTFGSLEPLLGPVVLNRAAPDWIIVGGLSGRNGQAMPTAWARDLRDQCGMLGRIFNFKQHGGRDAQKGGYLLDGRAHLDRPKVPPHV